MLQEEHKREFNTSLHDMIQGVKKSTMDLDRGFLKSVHEKEENFDELMKFYMPNGWGKFDYWEHSLMVDRAEDVLKLQTSGRLKKMKY